MTKLQEILSKIEKTPSTSIKIPILVKELKLALMIIEIETIVYNQIID
jgi:hypothetical protein